MDRQRRYSLFVEPKRRAQSLDLSSQNPAAKPTPVVGSLVLLNFKSSTEKKRTLSCPSAAEAVGSLQEAKDQCTVEQCTHSPHSPHSPQFKDFSFDNTSESLYSSSAVSSSSTLNAALDQQQSNTCKRHHHRRPTCAMKFTEPRIVEI